MVTLHDFTVVQCVAFCLLRRELPAARDPSGKVCAKEWIDRSDIINPGGASGDLHVEDLATGFDRLSAGVPIESRNERVEPG
jgi:hypothetical protein